ncbi:sensor histidine kinase [Persicitalea jodogahamensis]|uniref:histidine kinase n=1 Tax=Persicitalea jodogahamensis TaxID=402147 RepID=A0A8J3GC23_9BACT|nr:ATP-binding protein [Persicitalea jodogahamensis]GHB81517.1 two-component sensor histidine kinase [Persicitalea jodogahamensis]
MNIKARLTLLFTLLVASILLLFCFSVYYFYDQYREQQFSTYLQERVLTVTQLLEDVDGITTAEIKRIEETNNTILFKEEITVYDEGDSVIYDSGKTILPVSAQELADVRSGKEVQERAGDRQIIMLRHFHETGHWVIVAEAVDSIGLSKLDRLRDILAMGWLFSLVLVAVAGWIFARDAIKPVAEINYQVNNISAGNLHDRLRVGRERDELAKLAQTFNLMLDRLELAFKAQKSFVSHASHELRTPLAVMMADVEVTLMKERTSEEYKVGLQSVLEEVRSMNQMVNQLLELARTEEGVLLKSYRKVRLDEVLWQAQESVMQKNPDYEVIVKYDKIPKSENEIAILGEETLLRTAFSNLMENGCKYSDNKKMTVHLDSKAGIITLHFRDEGIGIDSEDIPFLFDTFYRSENTKNRQGYGIGLALTKRIIDIHKGKIDVISTPGVGSDFVVAFSHVGLFEI